MHAANPDLWDVWRVTYGTYLEPDVPPALIRPRMPFTAASQLVKGLGFGYCMKPSP